MSCLQKLENLEDDSVVYNERSPSSLSSSSPETEKKTRQVIIDVNEPVSEFCTDMRQIKQSEWNEVLDTMPSDDALKAAKKMIQCTN